MKAVFSLLSSDIVGKKRMIQVILDIYLRAQSLRKPPLSWKLKSLCI